MKQRLRLDLKLHPGVSLFTDPFTQNNLAKAAADYVAFRSDCLYGVRLTSLTADERYYCSPIFYKLKTAYVKDGSGDWHLLGKEMKWNADYLTGARWRNDTGEDPPQAAIYEGAGRVVLHAAPTVTRAGALAFEGFHKPGDFWTFTAGGVGEAITDDSGLPHPSWAHEAVYLHMKWQAAKRDERDEIRSQAGEFGAEFQEELDQVCGAAVNHTARIVQDYGIMGPWRRGV